VLETEHIFENKELKVVMFVQFGQDVRVISRQLETRVIGALMYIAQGEGLARRPSNHADRPRIGGQFRKSFDYISIERL